MTFDHRDLEALAVDLGRLDAPTHRAVRAIYAEASEDLAREWRKNETEASGARAMHYVKAITAEEKFGTAIVYEIGPDSSMKQGKMSFEYGSRNQPPHLSGNRAADALIPLIARRIETVVEGVFDA